MAEVLVNGSMHGNEIVEANSLIAVLQNALLDAEKRVTHLHTTFETNGDGRTRITVREFLDYLAEQRVHRIPHRAGRWDHVLKWAEYFATQVSVFEHFVRGFIAYSKETSEVVYMCLRALLDVGSAQAHALEKAFKIFYEEATTLFFFNQHKHLFDSVTVRQELGWAYLYLLRLVVDISVAYCRGIQGRASVNLHIHLPLSVHRWIRLFFKHRYLAVNAMWIRCIKQSKFEEKRLPVDISTIRAWLGAQSSGLPVTLNNPKAERSELGCEWFETHLKDFIRSGDNVFSIEGPPGSGKSVLASWITERLRLPIFGTRYIDIIPYFLDSSNPDKSTPLALVKGLLLQIFDREIGNVKLYKSLVEVYRLSNRSSTSSQIETELWDVLDRFVDDERDDANNQVVDKIQDRILLVDGLNEIRGDVSESIFKRLHAVAMKYWDVRVITTMQPTFTTSYAQTRRFTITFEHTFNDIRNLAHHFFTVNHLFRENIGQLEQAAEKVAKLSCGNFVFANLLLRLLVREGTNAAILLALERSWSIDEVLEALVKVSIHSAATRRIISWLLVAEDALTVEELQILLSVDASKGIKVPFDDKVEEILLAADALVIFQDGYVRLRHLSIRQHLLELATAGKALVTPSEANLDLLHHILLHIKLSLTVEREPGMANLEVGFVDDLYHGAPLLAYTVRHWTTHFKRSTLWNDGDVPEFTTAFKTLFPTSCIFALLEKTTWEASMSLTEAFELHGLALKIREAAFGQLEKSVLQSYLNLTMISESTGDRKGASRFCYKAFRASKTVLGQWSSFTSMLASKSWEMVNDTMPTNDEEFESCEDTLTYLITYSEHEHGRTSDATLDYMKYLVKLYSSLGKETAARAVRRKIKELKGRGITEDGMKPDSDIDLEDLQELEPIIPYTVISAEDLEASESLRVDSIIQEADAYEAIQRFVSAEELWITLWHALAQSASVAGALQSHTQLLDVMLKYVAFLRRQDRHQEASSILIGIWSEYEIKQIEHEEVSHRLISVGKELHALGAASIAVSLFVSVWNYFKRNEKLSSKGAADVAICLTNTIKEDILAEAEVSDTSILMEIFQATFFSERTEVVSETAVHTCQTLSQYYVHHEQWSESVEICTRILTHLWPSLATLSVTAELPGEYRQEAVEIAMREAHGRWKLSQLDHAEKIYLYAFHAVQSRLEMGEQEVTDLVQSILTFYGQTNQNEKLSVFYEELTETYRSSFGSAHVKTIQTLYDHATLLVNTKREEVALSIYEKIVTTLNQGSEICHQGALDAAIAYSKICSQSKSKKQVREVLEVLWRTVTQKTSQYAISQDLVKQTYEKYTYLLKTDFQVDYSTLHEIATVYRQTSITAFGTKSESAIQATIELADVCSQNVSGQQEAISLYEEAFIAAENLKITSSGLEKSLEMGLSKLTTLCESQENVERGVVIYQKQYESSKSRYGWSHSTTLSSLQSLVKLWTKTQDISMAEDAHKELTTAARNILITEEDSKKLHESAILLAQTYLAAGLPKQGWTLLQELRRQIISCDYSASSSWSFTITERLESSCYIFLSSFEMSLQGKEKTSFSLLMTDLRLESVLWKHYRAEKAKKDVDISLCQLAGARLRAFLVRKQYHEQAKSLEDELFELFPKDGAVEGEPKANITRELFVIMMDELAREKYGEHTKVLLGNAACNGGNLRVLEYLKAGSFREAYSLAHEVFSFVHAHRGYQQRGNVSAGFRLSLYMAGRGVPQADDAALREEMLALSREILRDTLDACRQFKVEFVSMAISELNDLLALMGGQAGHEEELERLLEQLWDARTRLRWPLDTTVSVGRCLVKCLFVRGARSQAIELCRDICHNLRLSWGPLDRTSVDMAALLSRLLTSDGRHAEAIDVHEVLLEDAVSEDTAAAAGGDDGDSGVDMPALAGRHLQLLKKAYQRNGRFEKGAKAYADLFARLQAAFGRDAGLADACSPAAWDAKEDPGPDGAFSPELDWAIELHRADDHQNYMVRTLGLYYRLLGSGLPNGKPVDAPS